MSNLNKIKEEGEKSYVEHITRYENDDGFNLMSAVRAKYGSVAVEEFLDSILDWHNKQMDKAFSLAIDEVEAEYGRMKETHLCRFNDGEQDCECYVKCIIALKQKLLSLKNKEN